MKSIFKIVTIISLLGLVIFGLYYNFKDYKKKDSSKNDNILQVDCYRTKRDKSIIKILSIGTISYKDKATISSKIDGKIEKIYVEKGDKVKANDLLATLDKSEINLQIRSMYSELEAIDANVSLTKEKLRKAEDNTDLHLKSIKKTELELNDKLMACKTIEATLNRKIEVHKIGGISDVQIEDLKTSYFQAKNQYVKAKQDLEIISHGFKNEDIVKFRKKNPKTKLTDIQILRLTNTKIEQEELKTVEASRNKILSEIAILEYNKKASFIRTPISGVVAQKSIEMGERVAKDKELFVTVNINPVYLIIFINENDIQKVKKDMAVEVVVDALGGRKFNGRIALISPVVDPSTRSIETKIFLNNQDELLKPGMFARAEIFVREIENVIFIPEKTVKDVDNKKAVVYCIKNNLIYLKEIGVLEKIEDGYIVDNGLDENEDIAISNLSLLKESMRVACKAK